MTNSLSDELMDKMAGDIQKEIDAIVMFNFFKQAGWYPVVNCKNLSFNHSALKEVELWLTTMCGGEYHIKSHTDYIFKRQDDALMFSLKWQ
jgi:hypothetical protein